MACSKYQYVKSFQQPLAALPQTFMTVRIDGRSFTKFSHSNNFIKPNDIRALNLMNVAAHHVMDKFQEIFMAYGQSDQYSFVFGRDVGLFGRRVEKICTCVVSAFTAAYVHAWGKYFQKDLEVLPSFDGRIVLYPSLDVLKDYFRWRQVDCHINNLYNTVFWHMVQQKGMKNVDVQNILKDTNSGQKNEILFKDFGVNYNDIQPVFRRGTVICYKHKDKTEQSEMSKKDNVKITKQLKTAIRQIKDATINTERVLNKIKNRNQKQEQGQRQRQGQNNFYKDLQQVKNQLQAIRCRYEKLQIENSQIKNSKINKNKQKANQKIQQTIKEQEIMQQVKQKEQRNEQGNQQKQCKPKQKMQNKDKSDKLKLISKGKYQRVECWDDLIKQQFWETIKIA